MQFDVKCLWMAPKSKRKQGKDGSEDTRVVAIGHLYGYTVGNGQIIERNITSTKFGRSTWNSRVTAGVRPPKVQR